MNNNKNNFRKVRKALRLPNSQIEERQLRALESIERHEQTQIRAFMERVPDVPKLHLKRDKVYTFTRVTLTNSVMSNSTVASIAFAQAPSLSNVPNSSEFVNLFEQYRIIQATWLFVPVFQGTANPLYTWFDPDDDSVPVGIAEGQQHQTTRISQSGQFVERTFTPTTSQDGIVTGSALTGYSAPNSMIWMDTDSLTNKYYGIKAVIAANTNVANAVPLYSIECSLVLQFRRPK